MVCILLIGSDRMIETQLEVPMIRSQHSLPVLTFLVFAFLALGPVSAEDVAIPLSEITVSATRVGKSVLQTPNAVSLVSEQDILRRGASLTPLILRETAGVWAQKTTHGQGSPILRGLTGYQTLLQVDGIRLNNSTFRSGPNQYLATVNAENIGRMEVLRGPASMQYGSGAMGGVVSVYTRDVLPSGEQGLNWSPQLLTRFGSADREKTSRFQLEGSYQNLGFLIGAGYKDVGDLRPGRGRDVQLNNRKFYITSDTDPDLPDEAWTIDTESPVDWREMSADATVNWMLGPGRMLKLGYQAVDQPDVPRYDKLATGEYKTFSFAPQQRQLVYGRYTAEQVAPMVDELRATLSYHLQKEGRKEVKSGSTSLRERFDTVHTTGASVQAMSEQLPRQRILLGVEAYHDLLDSRTVKADLDTDVGSVDETWGRFPDGSTAWDVSVFAQDEVRVHDRLEWTAGARLTHYTTEADLSPRDPTFGIHTESGDALTGSTGIVLQLAEGLNLVANAGTSFRNPNLNDTTAVEVTNEGVDAPTTDLDPERGASFEFGVKTKHRRFSGSATYYFSEIRDLITRVPVEEAFGNQPLPQLYQDIQVEHPDLDVFVQDNLDKVHIQGVELEGQARLSEQLLLFANATLTRGEVKLINGVAPNADRPWEARIRREPPPNALFGVQWTDAPRGLWLEFFARGAMKQARLSQGDIRDPRIPGLTRDVNEVAFDADGHALDAGTPGWFTLNLRGGYRIWKHATLQLGLENLLDRRYREHGSGTDAPGLNLLMSLRLM